MQSSQPGRRDRLRRILALGVVGFALLSAALSARPFLGRARATYREYEHTTRLRREQLVAEAAGLDFDTWAFVRSRVQGRHRYAIETSPRTSAASRRTVRMYAAYLLLPAIAVTDRRDADFVVYVGEAGPAASTCRENPERVCVLRVRR